MAVYNFYGSWILANTTEEAVAEYEQELIACGESLTDSLRSLLLLTSPLPQSVVDSTVFTCTCPDWHSCEYCKDRGSFGSIKLVDLIAAWEPTEARLVAKA